VAGNSRGYLLVLGAAAAWSTSGLFIRWTVAGSGLSALSLAFWRDLATFVSLLAGLALVRPTLLRVKRRDLLWLAALGAFGVGTFHVLWNLAILQIGYAIATVLLYFSPAFVTFMAWLVWREPLTRFKILAIGLALVGCVLVAGKEELAGVELTAGGLILGLVAAMAYGSFSLFGRQVAGRYSPWTVLTYGFGFGALALLPFQFGAALPWIASPTTWVWFGALVLLATIAPFGAYLAGLGRLPVSVASILAASEVVFGSVIGYLIFGEQLQALQIVGAGLVMGGVILIAMKGSAPASRKP
jgi:DME family drug/metabolite transporter